MKTLALSVTLVSLMIGSLCRAEMAVVPAKLKADQSTCAATNIDSVILPLAVAVQMKDGRVEKVLGCQVVNLSVVQGLLDKKDSGVLPGIETYSLGEGLMMVATGALKTVTGVVILVGVVFREMAPHVKNAACKVLGVVERSAKSIVHSISSTVFPDEKKAAAAA